MKMKKFFIARQAARFALLMLATSLGGTALAQDESAVDRRPDVEERRADFLENHPDAAQRREERRLQRQEYLANNPQAAARLQERRAHRQEGLARAEGRPHRGPDVDGRRDERTPGFHRGPGAMPGSNDD